MDRVLLALDGAGEVAPVAVGDRRRLVGLLHPRPDLGEDAVAELGDRGEHRFGVDVLGLEVGEHGGIVAVAEPVPVVDALVAVDLRASCGRRGACGGVGAAIGERA